VTETADRRLDCGSVVEEQALVAIPVRRSTSDQLFHVFITLLMLSSILELYKSAIASGRR